MTLLSETDLDFVDKVVETLCSGLILEQHREEILINEYAKTYLIIKFKPNRIEFIKKQNTIREVVSVFYTLNWFNCTSGFVLECFFMLYPLNCYFILVSMVKK